MVTKLCRFCHQRKSLEKFSRHPKTSDKYSTKCLKCNSEYHKKYNATTRGKQIQKERMRRWLENPANRERVRLRARRWAKANPEKRIEHENRRRARKRNQYVGPVDWKALLQQYDGLCAYCGSTATTMDHVIPLSRGGVHGPGNVVPSCASCNYRKHDLLISELGWILRKPA